MCYCTFHSHCQIWVKCGVIYLYMMPLGVCEFVKIDPEWAVIFLRNFQLRVSRKTFRHLHKERFGTTCVPRHSMPSQSCRGTETLIIVILTVSRLILSWALWPHPTFVHYLFNIHFSIILLYSYACFQVLRLHVNAPHYLRHECFMSGQCRWSWFGQVCRELLNISSLQLVFPRSSCINRTTNSKGVLVPMHRLTPWNWVLLREDNCFTIKKFSVLYGARHFIVVSTSPHFLYLSRARWIQSTPFNYVSLRFILKLSFHLRLGLKSRLFDGIKTLAVFLTVHVPFVRWSA
jgi:hypothetical protein